MISFVTIALLVTFTNATIFNGPCPDVKYNINYVGFNYRVIVLMPGNLSRNHFFRNIFGNIPDCWEFFFSRLGETSDKMNFEAYRIEEAYPFAEKSPCYELFRLNDRRKVKIDDTELSFLSYCSNVFPNYLPMMCSSELNWRSRIQAKDLVIKREGFSDEHYAVFWACEDLEDRHHLGIIVGFNSAITQNHTALVYERNRIFETSLELVRSLPFGVNFTIKDFQKAHLHNGVSCDLCEAFQCN